MLPMGFRPTPSMMQQLLGATPPPGQTPLLGDQIPLLTRNLAKAISNHCEMERRNFPWTNPALKAIIPSKHPHTLL